MIAFATAPATHTMVPERDPGRTPHTSEEHEGCTPHTSEGHEGCTHLASHYKRVMGAAHNMRVASSRTPHWAS